MIHYITRVFDIWFCSDLYDTRKVAIGAHESFVAIPKDISVTATIIINPSDSTGATYNEDGAIKRVEEFTIARKEVMFELNSKSTLGFQTTLMHNYTFVFAAYARGSEDTFKGSEVLSYLFPLLETANRSGSFLLGSG